MNTRPAGCVRITPATLTPHEQQDIPHSEIAYVVSTRVAVVEFRDERPAMMIVEDFDSAWLALKLARKETGAASRNIVEVTP